MPARTPLAATLAALASAALAAAALAAPAAPDPGGTARGGAAGFQFRVGRVAGVDWGGRRVTLEGAAGPADFGFDRNTVVYLPGRLGTLRDLVAGVHVRASVGKEGVAHFVQVQLPPKDPGPAPPPGGGPPR